MNEVKIHTEKYKFHNWMNYLRLERWRGLPNINVVKRYKNCVVL